MKLHVLPDMLSFSLCNTKRLAIQYMNRSLFPTLSILSYDIMKYQHLLVKISGFTESDSRVLIRELTCVPTFKFVNNGASGRI
jgi:hypothetical protein